MKAYSLPREPITWPDYWPWHTKECTCKHHSSVHKYEKDAWPAHLERCTVVGCLCKSYVPRPPVPSPRKQKWRRTNLDERFFAFKKNPICMNCGNKKTQHAGEQCLFGSTTFKQPSKYEVLDHIRFGCYMHPDSPLTRQKKGK